MEDLEACSACFVLGSKLGGKDKYESGGPKTEEASLHTDASFQCVKDLEVCLS
jgi:hypothetical protein